MTPLRLLPLVLLALLPAVPARAQAAKPAAGVPVAARDLPRGVVLAREDIALAPVEGGAAAGALPVGWVTRRMVAAGEVLREPTVARPDVIRNGDEVELLWSGAGVQVRARGRAMGAGAEGDRIAVRLDARRRFMGVVVGPGLVRMEGEGTNR